MIAQLFALFSLASIVCEGLVIRSPASVAGTYLHETGTCLLLMGRPRLFHLVARPPQLALFRSVSPLFRRATLPEIRSQLWSSGRFVLCRRTRSLVGSRERVLLTSSRECFCTKSLRRRGCIRAARQLFVWSQNFKHSSSRGRSRRCGQQ